MKTTDWIKRDLKYDWQKDSVKKLDAMTDEKLFDEILTIDSKWEWTLDYAITLLKERLGWR